MTDQQEITTEKGELDEAKREEAQAQVIVKHVPVAARSGSKDDEQPDELTTTPGNMIPKARFDQVNKQKKDALDALKAVADSLAEDVPEDFRGLIPELSPADKIAWIRTALKMGIFRNGFNEGIDTKRPGGKPPMDLSNMTPEQMMSRGYR